MRSNTCGGRSPLRDRYSLGMLNGYPMEGTGMTDERQFYATIEVEEYGEAPREKRVGPFYAEDEDALRDNLEAQGDHVLVIEAA